MYKYKKYLKKIKQIKKYICEISKKISQKYLDQTLEREREEGEEKQLFSGDFTGFCRSELSMPRVKSALQDESYAWVPESQDFAKVQGSGYISFFVRVYN